MVLTSSLRGVGKIGISMLLNIGYALLNGSLVYICSFNLEKGIIFTLAVYILMSVFIFILKDRITALMLTDENVISQAILYLKIVAPSYLFFGAVLMTITTLEQINKGKVVLSLNLIYFVFIDTGGWYMTNTFGRIDYLYWTISGMNIVSFVDVFFILMKIKKEYVMDEQVTN